MTHVTPSQATSVYRYYDQNDVLLYVGITSRRTARQGEHDGKEWWPYVTRQEVEHYQTRTAAGERERSLIVKFHPPFNKQHNAGWADVREAYLRLVAGKKLSPTALLRLADGATVDGRKRFELEIEGRGVNSLCLASLSDDAHYMSVLDTSDLRGLHVGSGGRRAKLVAVNLDPDRRLRLLVSGNRLPKCNGAELMLRYHGNKRLSIKRLDLSFPEGR